MKNLALMFMAAVLGGIVVIGGQQFIQSDSIGLGDEVKIVRASTTDASVDITKEQTAFVSVANRFPSNTPNSFVESAKRSTGSVVHIYAEESDELVREQQKKRRSGSYDGFFSFEDIFGGNFYRPKNGSGSGVIYSGDGYIITNNHVVGFADKITVTDSKGKKYNAKKIGTDESTDLAIIKIESNNSFQPIRIGDSDMVNVGEWVLAVGNPFGYLTSTVTAGIVSAKGRSLDIIQDDKAIEEFIQTDAAINPGNSGGALVNLDGELIGINTAIATPTGVFAGYSFAIPAKIVAKVAKDIIENGGNIERTNLGIGGYDVTKDLVSELKLKLKSPVGFYVEEVVKSSAAQLGGILPGDVIIAIDNNNIVNYDDVDKALKFNKVGDKVKIKIVRDGRDMMIPVQLRKRI